MNFTPTPPTELGAYWWRETEYHQPKVVTIEQTPYIQGLAAFLADGHAVYEIDKFPKGLWSAPLVPKTPDCRWTNHANTSSWDTSCGTHFFFGDPMGETFCAHCGGRIITS
jgi:hypothetical protein